MKLSIIVPVYNEEHTISSVIHNITQVFASTDYEILVIDDGSTDSSLFKIQSIQDPHVRYTSYKENKGKGFAIQKGLPLAQGDYVAIQDADLEYSPQTLRMLWDAVGEGIHIVYGKRTRALGYIANRIANSILSHTCNILYGSTLFDIYTCYKIVPKKILENLHLSSHGFEIEAEITAKLLRKKLHITEMPITYNPRTLHEGKKIRAKDGVVGLWTLCKYRLLSDWM